MKTTSNVVTPFATRCYQALSTVPAGKVTTYKLLARAIGSRAVRAVGSAMRKNPNAPKVPCHRVVRSDGAVGEYALGQRRKVEILQKEGVKIQGGKVANLASVLYAPKRVKRS